MSRICVKNLPRYVGEDRLKDYFSRKGEITDVKIMRTKDGKSRQLAFIGFRTSAEAEEAIKFFHDSYLDTSRIKCEIAHKVGDPNIPRPWSRHSAVKKGLLSDNNSEGVGRTPKGSKGTVVGKEKTKKKENNKDADPQFEEFLQLMQPRIKSKLWANDTIEASVDIKTQEGNVRQDQVRNDSKRGTRKRDHSGPKDDPSMEGPVDRDNIVLAGDELRSNKDYYRGKAYKTRSDLDNDEEGLSSGSERDGGAEVYEGKNSEKFEYANVEASENVVPDVVDSVEKDSRREKVLETGRLFVRNLPYTSTEEDLEELFNKYGDVSQVHLVVDKHTNRSKGFAYVLYTTPECAVRALEDVDHSIFQGRLLHVMPAEQPPEQKEHKSFAGETSKTFKEQRLEKRKASEASGDTRAWNSFFMHSDTVAENIARRFGVSKSKLLDREADDLAVRLALGETQIIGETKKALANAGVNVKALEELASGKSGNDKRSNHVILVKNLPYSSSEEELVSMFSKFGSLDKVIVPPTKALALIIFLEASEARAAFKGLAYKRYKDTPLYLEWSVDNILCSSSKVEVDGQLETAVGEKEVKKALLEQNVQGISEVDIDPDRVESRSVFVKNLNFKTTDDVLRKHMAENLKGGKILSVKIKKHLKNGKNLSMGFGFIEFDSLETATNVCRDLQGTVLEGHALILQLCRAKNEDDGGKKVNKNELSTKLIVRNVAFEATDKDLRQLFSPFGQIKRLRMPKKVGGHRGFVFVEFVTKQEAQNALQSLANTHLYGRHLVIEKAKEGDTLEELRARAAAQFTEHVGLQNTPKLSKKRKIMPGFD